MSIWLTTFFSSIKKALVWIKLNIKWIALILCLVFVSVLLLVARKRGKKVDFLLTELATLRAKIQIEKLAAKNDVLVEDLKEIKEKDESVRKEIEKIEITLVGSLENLSTKEIAEKFKELGI